MSSKLPWRLIWPFSAVFLLTLFLLTWYSSRAECRLESSCTWGAFLLAAGLGLVAIVLAGLYVAAGWRRPVDALTQTIQQLTQGEPSPYLLPQHNESLSRLIIAVNRLTEQWQSERETLLSEQQQLATVLNQLATGVLITEANGNIELANPAALRLLRVKDEKAVARSFVTIARHHQLIELWQRCRSEGTEQVAVVELGQRRDLFLQAIISPFQEHSEEKCLILLQDLTRVQHLEKVRRDLISNVSHEFRTPLASLRALVETLQESALDDPPAAQHFLRRTAHEVDTLTQIVEELLTLSRIEGGQVALQLQPTAPGDLLLATAERFQPQAERQGIALQVDVAAGLPKVLADEGQILTVLSNLVHNAIKFTPQGGHITLGAQQAYESIRFKVADTGTGIPADDLPRIFERFYKADRARQRQVGGTGLGLAIAKHTIAAHDGQIWAESRVRRGSTFYFTLPMVA